MNNWQFQEPENVVVVTTRKVLMDHKPILHVSHDEDDGVWQFHSGDQIEVAKDSLLVSLKSIVEYDTSINDLADLPLGWQADRKTINDLWVRKEQESIVDENL